MFLESLNDGSLIVQKNDIKVKLSPKECVGLYHYLNEKHFSNHPNIFIDKSIGGAFCK
jgi:hypothetical protein